MQSTQPSMFRKGHCDELASPDITNFCFSIFIVLGILISYLPQHYKIISRRSSRGLAPMFVLLGTVSGTASIANILTLPESRSQMGCCKEISAFACSAALLGIAQIGVQWSCFFFIMLLFLIFFPRQEDEEANDPTIPTWKQAISVLSISMAFFILTFIGSIAFIYASPSHLGAWANFLGVLGTILAAVQYLPQIYTTWKLQKVESLSVPMMCIQTPGSFVFAGSLAARLGAAGWSTWGLFVVTGCLQGSLLGLAISFLLREKREKKDRAELPNGHGGEGQNRPSENTPLLDGS